MLLFIACVGCILESLQMQKDLNKLAQAKWAAQQASAGLEAEAAAQKLKDTQRANFEKLDAALLKHGNARTDNTAPPPVRPASAGPSPYAPSAAASAAAAASTAAAAASSTAAPAGYVRVETNSGTGFIVDRDAVHAQNDPSASRELQGARKEYFGAFWMPSMAPADVGEAKMSAPPPTHCLCPGSNHTLRLKQLRPLHWHMERERSEATVRATSSSGATSTTTAAFKPMCFACKRRLQNQTPMMANLKCGHVVCVQCVNTIMKAKKSTTTTAAASAAAASTSSAPAAAAAASGATAPMLCAECEDPCSADDLVQIVASTGFAATGNTIAKSKLTPAFLC